MRWWTLIFGAGLAWGQLTDVAILDRAVEKMRENLLNQPNYTCLETVERSRLEFPARLQVQDTLRIEVAVVDGKEMFAWPGAKEFEDREIRELVPTGMFGNGNYAIYARMLFLARVAEFRAAGEVELAGLKAKRYDFTVPVTRSGLTLRTNEATGIAGFHGSIYVDPATADLRRLEVFADEIPADLRLDATEDRVDYARAFIGDEEFLLPVESYLRMVSKENDSRNLVRFSGCRKFAGASTLIFDDVEIEAQTKAPVEIREVELPLNALMVVEFRDEIQLDKAAVGDEVNALLKGDIRKGRERIVPKDARMKGRILRLDRYDTAYVLLIEFADFEWTGGHARAKVKLDGLSRVSTPRQMSATPAGDLVISRTGRASLKGMQSFWRVVR